VNESRDGRLNGPTDRVGQQGETVGNDDGGRRRSPTATPPPGPPRRPPTRPR
jgi:hypothetical protein